MQFVSICPGDAEGLAKFGRAVSDDIEAVVHAVGEVDINMAGGAEHRGSAGSNAAVVERDYEKREDGEWRKR